jgi:quinoprotein glucose dehydrogenase
MYFCDWVEGWNKPNKGNLYRVIDPSRRDDPKVREVQTLLAQGMDNHSNDELARLLAHPDMRVRQEAQFAMVARGEPGLKAFARIAGSKEDLLARIHAIWGLGQMARMTRQDPRAKQGLWSILRPLLDDPEPEVRAQAAKALGDAREPKGFDRLIGLLDDASPRVPFAAMALGKLGRGERSGHCWDAPRQWRQDPYLRHAGVMGLVGSGMRRH